MNADVARYVPMGLVIAVIGYCLWPYLAGPSQAFNAEPAAKPPEITKAMLAGADVPPPARDPFHPADAIGATRATASAVASQGVGARTAVTKNRSADPFQGLVLEATCISAGLRLATINGRVYHQRETMRPAAVGSPSCVLAQVLPDRVVLEAKGKTHELKYSNVSLTPKK